jgi:hypothetical protein
MHPSPWPLPHPAPCDKDLEVPETFDALIVNVLTPAFTPAFLIFLFFSVTFGLFKFAQISSSQTVYKEVE